MKTEGWASKVCSEERERERELQGKMRLDLGDVEKSETKRLHNAVRSYQPWLLRGVLGETNVHTQWCR